MCALCLSGVSPCHGLLPMRVPASLCTRSRFADLHAKRIIHFDVKTPNVLLARQAWVTRGDAPTRGVRRRLAGRNRAWSGLRLHY